MALAQFKVNTLDLDTRIEYPASAEFVEVSDAFADRLFKRDPKGDLFEIEGYEYKKVSEYDSADEYEVNELRANYFAILGKKPGRSGADKMKAEIEEAEQKIESDKQAAEKAKKYLEEAEKEEAKNKS